jgi:NADPH-dependent 2,4-dienoyl-CoA reductase/sulfur reductase-like enzyme
MTEYIDFDVVVVGAGPAGMAAAVAAARHCQSVALIESGPWVGGQLWRNPFAASTPRVGKTWFFRLQSSSVRVFTEATVVDNPCPGTLLIETPQGTSHIGWNKLILAVGARERFIPFPGWTLPHVFGAGGLQLLAKNGWPVRGKRIVVAGSGPLLIAVAAQLRKRRANVILIAEQTSLHKLMRFGLALPGLAPAKLLQAAQYKTQLLGVPFKTSAWPVQAHGKQQLESVTLHSPHGNSVIPCDYLACAFGLVPNLEMPRLLGCKLNNGFVQVDTWQQTSVDSVYCVGEPTGMGGMDRALVEGQIAGYAAADQKPKAKRLFKQRQRTHAFTHRLNLAFALRLELKQLTTPETIVCRCEDVTLKDIMSSDRWQAAKLHTRCGMGLCQGRTCGSALQFLMGWENDSVRPPVFPTRLETLMQPLPQNESA